MNDEEMGFSNLFEGIHKVRKDIDNELSLLQTSNAEQKEELRKAKRFNTKMAVIAWISMVVSIISLVLAIVTIFRT